jgi:hypothetical protein
MIQLEFHHFLHDFLLSLSSKPSKIAYCSFHVAVAQCLHSKLH